MMREEPREQFSENEASRIWRRAAELQARRKLPLPSGERQGAEADAAAAAEPHLSREDVVAVAQEAGIEPEFIQQALTEAVLVPTAEEDGEYPALRSRRRIGAAPAVVQPLVREVAEGDPYKLRLTDIRTAAEGRTLIFEIGDVTGEAGLQTLRAGDFGSGRNATTLHAVVLPAGESEAATELILYCPPNPDLPRSARWHDIGFGLLGAVGVGGAGGAGLTAVLALSGAAVAAPVAAAAVAGGGAGVYLVRALHWWSQKRDSASLEKLADDVVGAVRIRTLTNALPRGGEPEAEA
jgi:hypothetical protein